ncbi:MAG: iron-containing alcohol dehydrogenase [Actinobacteria bacterium]|nr:iron-containing alcohol dehydrogenase [Actinomycetota bacterium]
MGAGKTTLGEEVARALGRPFVDLDRELEERAGQAIPRLFEVRGEEVFRVLETRTALEVLRNPEPAVIALGGGAISQPAIRACLAEQAVTALVEVDVDEAWQRVRESGRPLARDERRFRDLYNARDPLYREAADAIARDADDVVLAAGGVHIEPGSLAGLGSMVPGAGPVALVSDARVAGIHGRATQVALGERLVSTHELPPGEEAKTAAACQRLWEELELGRDGILVALGGGSTTDVAGFVAATSRRGLPWVPVPTTLVGQVDAAIGGKTAVNLSRGKNLVGAFHWPLRTVIDPLLLETLPEEEHRAGLAEAVKTGLLAGFPFWREPPAELVRRCAAFKVALCLRDPLDEGPRAALNLGHTFAHALEAAGSFSKLSHGDAVALGLRAALKLSVEEVGLDPAVLAEVESLLPASAVEVDREEAWRALAWDKKAVGGRPRLVLLEAPGRPVVGVELPPERVRAALDGLLRG